MCVAEGAIRSGKTIDHCIIAAAYLEECPDKFHLASGSTIGNAKLNIGVCNGFGLENIFRGRCRWGKFKDNEALFIQTRTGEKVVVFAGGAKADAYKRILGNSYGLWIATEINEHFDSTDSRISFIKVASGRQIAAQKPFTLWDLNPCNPRAVIYEEYIDKYRRDGLAGGYQYEHFTIKDNATITPERLREIESQYNPETVWYRRDILGERAIAEGLIYQQFADRPDLFCVDDVPGYINHAVIGVDFGGGSSAHAFCCVGYFNNCVVVLDEYREKEALNPTKLEDKFIEFVRRCQSRWLVTDCWCDSAEQTLINGLRVAAGRNGIGINIGNSLKRPINDRIRAVCLLMGSRRFYVNKACKWTIDALKTAIWDSKKLTEDVRLDNGTTNIDSLDAMEYAIERDIPTLIEGWR
jgi:phage terminase large subunit